MTRDEVIAFFARRQEAWDRRDAEALARSHAERGTVHSPMFATVTGRDKITASYRSLFDIFPDWTFISEEPFVDGDRVALPFSVRATHAGEFMGLAGSGRRFQIQGVLLIRMEGGLIADERRTYDFTGLLVQLGIVRGKTGKG